MAATQPAKDSVMRKRVLITGAQGFTGRYLAAALGEAGHEVHGLAQSGLGAATVGVAVKHTPGVAVMHQADLADPAALTRVVQEVQPHQVAHLAAIAFVAHGDAQAMYTTNLLGTRNLLEALLTAPSPPEAVLLASSANVYGNGPPGAQAHGGDVVLTEASATAPANDYAVSKLAMEYLAQLYANRLPLIITRPFNYTHFFAAKNCGPRATPSAVH
jgi:GDP-6-deoxy-D-talose 4-dehydrogenase